MTSPIAPIDEGDYFDAGRYGGAPTASMAGLEEATIVRDSTEWRPALAAVSALESRTTGATIAALPLFSTDTAQYPRTAAFVRPDQSPWALSPATQRRLPRTPAPVALRLGVMALAVVFVVVAVTGLGVLVRPSMFPHASPSAPVATPALVAKTTSGRFRLLNTSSSRATYSVPTRHYTLVISVTHPCWVTVKSADGTTVFAKTLLASTSPADISVTGATHLTLAAQASSVVVREGSTALGKITSPKLGLTYAFQPGASASS